MEIRDLIHNFLNDFCELFPGAGYVDFDRILYGDIAAHTEIQATSDGTISITIKPDREKPSMTKAQHIYIESFNNGKISDKSIDKTSAQKLLSVLVKYDNDIRNGNVRIRITSTEDTN